MVKAAVNGESILNKKDLMSKIKELKDSASYLKDVASSYRVRQNKNNINQRKYEYD